VPGRRAAELGRLGHAFQLANFIRDAAEDARLDRVYFPADDRARFGVAEDDVRAARATPELRALLAAYVARARRMFAVAAPVIAAAPASVRPGIRLAVSVYERMLDRAEARDFDVLGRPPQVRPWQLPAVALGALRP
jgi:phytoene synthase